MIFMVLYDMELWSEILLLQEQKLSYCKATVYLKQWSETEVSHSIKNLDISNNNGYEQGINCTAIRRLLSGPAIKSQGNGDMMVGL